MTIPAVLLERFDALDGCQGDWWLMVEPNSPYFRYQGHTETVRVLGNCFLADGEARTMPEALEYCCRHHWRGIRLIFTPCALDGRDTWPGGYAALAAYAANQQYVEEHWGNLPAVVDCDGMPGIDPRFLYGLKAEDLLETVQALESYPVICEELMGQIELERQEEEWESWAKGDWETAVRDALAAYAPEAAEDPEGWAIDRLEAVPELEQKLRELFELCREAANQYWKEESDGSQYIRLEPIAAKLDRCDLADLTGLPLLDPSQQWRNEPYPWPGATPSPLIPALEA